MVLKKYRHIPIEEAEEKFKEGQERKFRVFTINWTFASNHKRGVENKVDFSKVHSNIYEWSLKKLIKWIRETEEVAEDIYKIEEIEKEE